jgi:hypothetical protein
MTPRTGGRRVLGGRSSSYRFVQVGRGSQNASCSGPTTSVENAAGALDARPDAVEPKIGPSVIARPATFEPNAAQLPCSGACPAAAGVVTPSAATASVSEIVLVRMSAILSDDGARRKRLVVDA